MENAIFITGCSRRIGLYLVNKFLDQGHFVIAHYRTMTPELEKCKNRNSVLVQADLCSEKHVKEMVRKVRAISSSFRAIIHNASSYEPTSKNIDKSIAQYHQFFLVHMMAPFIINEGLHDRLLKNERMKDIIHITDTNAERPDPSFDIYSSTKAGMASLTRSFAKKYAPKIKVNSIAPGPVLFSKESKNIREKVLAKTLLGKEGGANCIYQAVCAILNNEFMTGSTLYVDGGRMLG